MRLSYLFSFIVLFGMLGVLFMIHVQDLMEVTHQESTEPGVQVDSGETQVTRDQRHRTQNTSTSVPTPSPAHHAMDTPPRRQAPPPDTPRRAEQWKAEPPPRGRRRRRRRNALAGTRPRLRHRGMSERGDPKSVTRRLGEQEETVVQSASRRLTTQEDLQSAPRRLGPREQEDLQSAPRRLGPRQQEDLQSAPRRLGARVQEDLQSAPRRLGARVQEDLQSAPRRLGARERRRLWAVQQERRQLVEEACLRYRGGGDDVGPGPGLLAPHHVSRIYVEERHRLLYCEVPKAGCSNWKRVLMVLGGLASSPAHIGHQAAHYGNALRRLDSFDGAGVARRLRTYTKALFVREPLERLVSAFRDKLEQPNAYYQPLFGRAIIGRYRPNATLQALRSGSGVTFPEFVRYLLDPRRPLGLDIHWEPVGRLCSPCLVRYDFIGRFESLGAEAEALLRLVGAPANLTFPTFKDRHRRQERTGPRLSRRYLAQLSADERRRLQDFYLADYTMFNYAPPFRGGAGLEGWGHGEGAGLEGAGPW